MILGQKPGIGERIVSGMAATGHEPDIRRVFQGGKRRNEAVQILCCILLFNSDLRRMTYRV